MPRFDSAARLKAGAASLGEWLYPRRGWWVLPLLVALVWARWHSSNPLQPWGALLIFAALGLRAWAGMHIGSHSNGASAEAPHWATSGPYAFMRHPLYVANVGVTAGLLVFANCLPLWAGTVLMVAIAGFYTVLAWHEEARILQRHPEARTAFRGLGWVRSNSPIPKVDFQEWMARQARNTAYSLLLLLGMAAIVALKRVLES